CAPLRLVRPAPLPKKPPEVVIEEPLTTLADAPDIVRAPVIVSPVLSTLVLSGPPERPVRCEPSPKKAEAVTELTEVIVPAEPVRPMATLFIVREPDKVPPARGSLVLSVAVTPVSWEPLRAGSLPVPSNWTSWPAP